MAVGAHSEEARGRPRSDRSIARRVRRRIRKVCSHPDVLGVTVHDQVVALDGPILSPEHDLVVVAAGEVAGVLSVRDRLTVYSSPGTVPELQGRDARGWRRRLGAAAERIALLLLGLGLFWSASRIARRTRENREPSSNQTCSHDIRADLAAQLTLRSLDQTESDAKHSEAAGASPRRWRGLE